MRIADSLTERLLKKTDKKITDEQIAELHKQEVSEKKPLQDLVIKNNLVSEKELTKLYAEEIEVPLMELNAKDIKREVLQLLPERIARQYHAVVFDIDENGTKLVAMEDPDDIQALNFLQKQLSNNIRVYISTASQLQAALDQYREDGSIGSELTQVISGENQADESEEPGEEDLAEDSPIAQTVNLIIEYGVKATASDIHIEPRENIVIVRYRIDGMLREVNKLPRKMLNALVSRIKILSNLKIDEHRVSQDGRFKVQVGSNLYAIRVSTLPIVDGEKVVMRILNESNKAATFADLGFWGNALETLQHAIIQPHGMILVTGPTGSGKSTTLFSILSMLNMPNVNISTVEDPVEYRIPGVNQTQVNPIAGMTFSNGLRALLRQDPNIIMVGEVRDKDTADLAVQAALTGHLVFSTLHTNNAATSLPRLLDMGTEPFLIASTVRVVIGQRLVRRLCTECRQTYTPNEAEFQHLVKVFNLEDNLDIKHINELEKKALEGNIGKPSSTAKDTSAGELSSTANGIKRLWKANDDGCVVCNHAGYKGRIGIYEVLHNSVELEKLIVTSATSETIEDISIKEGMLTMQIDGFIKALRGETTVEEILRATSTED
ncbi:MAG: GspE/PulE family protein [Candidatus Saccharimonadales bacterium]